MMTISWAASYYFPFLIPLLFMLIALVCYRLLWQKKTVNTLTSNTFQSQFLKRFSLKKSLCKTFLLVLALIALVCALARPQWNDSFESVEQKGRDVLIALDISRSMLAQDLKPSRLEFAKDKIKKLLTLFEAERVGLIVFSSSSFVQCPLTSDMHAFLSFLDATDVETLSSGTTDIASALEKALEIFERIQNQKSKILVIFTDGEDFSSKLADVKKRAQELGVHIFTVGVGTSQGAPIPILDAQGNIEGYQKDERGSIVLSRLNEKLLYDLAKDSGALYLKATADASDINTLTNRIQTFEKDKYEDKKISSKQEKYYYFGFFTLFCLLLEWLL